MYTCVRVYLYDAMFGPEKKVSDFSYTPIFIIIRNIYMHTRVYKPQWPNVCACVCLGVSVYGLCVIHNPTSCGTTNYKGRGENCGENCMRMRFVCDVVQADQKWAIVTDPFTMCGSSHWLLGLK